MPRPVRPTTVYSVALRELEVVRVTDITSGMRRVTLTGDQLDAHTRVDGIVQRAFVSDSFDDDVRLFFPYPGESEPVLPVAKDGGFSLPKDRDRMITKVYTVRSYDPETRELDIDFVKHGVGVATTWAYRAVPGDRIHVFGPAFSLGLPDDADWLLVIGDDTAVPAIARLLEELPDDSRGQVFIEIAKAAHRQQLRELPGVQVTWLPRDTLSDGAAPGTTTLLLDAVRATEWWDGDAFAWIAGEQATVRDLRRHLVEDRGLDKSRIAFTGYWKRQAVIALEEDAAVPDPERNEEAFETFHELAELLPPLAIRTAANLGVAEHITRGTATLPGLAAATGADERALGKFLRYLTAIELLEQDGDAYALTDTGEFLTDEDVLDHLASHGVQARKELAFFGLEQAVRTGQAVYEQLTGRDYQSLRRDPDYEHKLLENAAQFAAYSAEPLAGAEALAGAEHIVLHANDAEAVAAALVARHPAVRVTIPALPAAAMWLLDDLPRTIPDAAQRERVQVIEQSVYEQTPAADIVLIINMLAEHPDADAALILRRAIESLTPNGRVLLLESTLDDDADEHETEHDLLLLALHGSGNRTAAELDQVITAAGSTIVGTETIGWGDVLRILGTAGR